MKYFVIVHHLCFTESKKGIYKNDIKIYSCIQFTCEFLIPTFYLFLLFIISIIYSLTFSANNHT